MTRIRALSVIALTNEFDKKKAYEIVNSIYKSIEDQKCSNCKNLMFQKHIIICDIHNYYLTEESIEVLKCNEWESK